MRTIRSFLTEHDGIIHDVSYDFYGKRIATCSADQHIKVWDQDPSGNWQCTADWKAHLGNNKRVCWAHPEFGQVLASCSADKSVCIWEEKPDEPDPQKRWQKKASLVDSRGDVNDIKFAPRHLGLKIATSSDDGLVRLYQAVDVMNLSHWSLMDEFETHKEKSVTCISWNPSRFEPQMLAVGSKNDVGLKIWEYNDQYRRWQVISTLVFPEGPTEIHDVSWAPNMGRNYHLIAAGSKDGFVRIWKVSVKQQSDRPKLESELVASFTDHNAEVWRTEWNVTGTILASSGDDGTVRLWKANFADQWKCLSVMRGQDGSSVTPA